MIQEQIQQRAHEIWEDRVARGIEGTPEGDWTTAERELSPGAPVEEEISES